MPDTSLTRAAAPAIPSDPLTAWLIDAAQRSILFLDTLRERGNTYQAATAETAPHVLSYRWTLVQDGRALPRPVNYGLVQIIPPEATPTNPALRPFIVVDPRAGHGPGIGGMKSDSEIGKILALGHPCYFVGFTTAPVPGQTIEDVCHAEAAFIQTVIARHPLAPDRPAIIANCQAGWQVAITAALHPGLAGPLVLAGAPMSYWAGIRGHNPLRYLGGLLGGTWLTALAGDLGAGIFDGANLVANFESMNPSNTYWSKPYTVYSKVDTEAARFLSFETWWGSPVLLNAEEMQWIADNLFVGNRLATGLLRTTDGTRIDLRNIQAPIIVFCSRGDDITPPQQALGWITDLYADDAEFAASGQTIVYCVHDSIGHLGIFVSSKVATEEHDQFIGCMDMIETVPPGLYEAVMTSVTADTPNAQLIHGDFLTRLQPRRLDDIRAFGGNDAADELRFQTMARVSEINLGLYRLLMQPAIRAMVTPPVAETLRATHPNRLRFGMLSDKNPLMAPVQPLAAAVRAARAPVAHDNPFVAMERLAAQIIVASLDSMAATRATLTEAIFLSVYGNPVLQALTGLWAAPSEQPRRAERDLIRETRAAEHAQALAGRFEQGGLVEATLRALLHVAGLDGPADERVFRLIDRIRARQDSQHAISRARFRAVLTEQLQLMRLDSARAVAAIPALLRPDPVERKAAFDVIVQVLEATDPLTAQEHARLDEMRAVFLPPTARVVPDQAVPPPVAATPEPIPAAPETPPAPPPPSVADIEAAADAASAEAAGAGLRVEAAPLRARAAATRAAPNRAAPTPVAPVSKTPAKPRASRKKPGQEPTDAR